jgi:DNA-directed RNA polymerase subunit RPC12/RpoP
VPPLGRFVVQQQPKERRRFRLNKVQTLYRQRSKVVFHPCDLLRCRLANNWRPIPEEIKVTTQKQQLACPKCGSTHFAEGEFRKYYQMPSAMPGGGLLALDGTALPALICPCGERCFLKSYFSGWSFWAKAGSW